MPRPSKGFSATQSRIAFRFDRQEYEKEIAEAGKI
jgi:hypothetical protein